MPESELVAIVEADGERAAADAESVEAEATSNFEDVIGRVDAAVIASPTSTHFEIARHLLQEGIHLLIEKPITTTVDEARELVAIARDNSAVLQVGHLERFNPAILAIASHVQDPQFIESHRIAPYKPRALDVSVVLDLMIHDIDLIHGFVGAPMTRVDAVGREIFTPSIDVANARIQFANGCVANVTSSRSSMKTERTFRVFQPDSYISADLHNKSYTRYATKGDGPVTGPDDIAIDKQTFGDSDAMMDQMRAFLGSINGGPPPLVDGQIATEALEIAAAITESVRNQSPT